MKTISLNQLHHGITIIIYTDDKKLIMVFNVDFISI